MGNRLFGVDVSGLVARHIGPGVLSVVLTEPVVGARAPGNLTGGRVALAPKTHKARGFWEDFKGMSPPGVTVELGDRKAVILGDTLPPGVVPARGWKVEIENVSLFIYAAIGRDPAAAVYTYQCRDRLGPDKV